MSDLTKVNEIVFRQLDRLEEASSQVRCRACIDERPTWGAMEQSRTRDRRG